MFILKRIFSLSFLGLLNKLLLLLLKVSFIANSIRFLNWGRRSPISVYYYFFIFLLLTFIFYSYRRSGVIRFLFRLLRRSKLNSLGVFVVISFLYFPFFLELLQEEIVTCCCMVVLVGINTSNCVLSLKAFLL